MKRCSKCQEEKEPTEFNKNKRVKSGLTTVCKECHKIGTRKYYQKNKESLKQCAVKYRKENRSEILVKDRQRYQVKKDKLKNHYHQNRDEILSRRKELYSENKESYRLAARRKYQKRKIENPDGIKKERRDFYERHKNDPQYKMRRSIRWGVARISRALKTKKDICSLDYLGCSLDELKVHLESLWQEGMTWDNYGVRGWHIDHIKPLDWFAKNSSNPWEANYYTNLQPLWAKDNLSKGSKLDY